MKYLLLLLLSGCSTMWQCDLPPAKSYEWVKVSPKLFNAYCPGEQFACTPRFSQHAYVYSLFDEQKAERMGLKEHEMGHVRGCTHP